MKTLLFKDSWIIYTSKMIKTQFVICIQNFESTIAQNHIYNGKTFFIAKKKNS